MSYLAWYRLPNGALLKLVRELPSVPPRLRDIADALAMREKGIDPWADVLIADADAAYETSSRGGRKSHPPSTSHTTPLQPPCNPLASKEGMKERRREREIERPKEANDYAIGADGGGADAFRVSGKQSGDGGRRLGEFLLPSPHPPRTVGDPVQMALADPKVGIHDLPAVEVPRFMVAYCGETENPLTLGTFKKYFRVLGSDGFRTIAAAFVAECEVGEEPENRGAAFTARLKREVGDGT